MKKKVSENAGDLIDVLTGTYGFAKNIGNPLAAIADRTKTGFNAEQQRAYEIFRKNFISDIADLIDYGVERGKFTTDISPITDPSIATAKRPQGSRTVSYPDDFKGSRTWTNTKDWLQVYRDELEAIANKDPEVPPPPKPQIRSQISLPIDTPPEPGEIPQASARTAQDFGGDWRKFDSPAYKRKQPVTPPQGPKQTSVPGVSEPVTFGGVKYYKVNGRWVNGKGKLADKNTSDLLDRVPLDESYPVTATVNGITYIRSKDGWYCDEYKAVGELAKLLNESYMSALLETINYKKLQKKYTQLLEAMDSPTLGQYLYANVIKRQEDASDLKPEVRQEIQKILDRVDQSVVSKNSTQLTKDFEQIAYLIFANSYNLMPRLLRKSKR